MRRLPFLVYLVFVAYAGFRLYAYSFSFDGVNTSALVTMVVLWIAALPWSVVFLLLSGPESKSMGMGYWLLFIWGCVAINLLGLGYLAWKRPKTEKLGP